MYKVKTIDIQAKEWFDRVNCNSYFSARVTVNFGMEDAEQIVLPYQYGYGEFYKSEAQRMLFSLGFMPPVTCRLSKQCREAGIILRASIQEKCLQRDVKAFGAIASTTDRITDFKAN